MTHAARKHQAHHLLDAISAEQLNAVVGLLEVMSDPLSRRLALAPLEDELVSDEENAQAAAACGPWIPMEAVMAELGITHADLDLRSRLDRENESSVQATH